MRKDCSCECVLCRFRICHGCTRSDLFAPITPAEDAMPWEEKDEDARPLEAPVEDALSCKHSTSFEKLHRCVAGGDGNDDADLKPKTPSPVSIPPNPHVSEFDLLTRAVFRFADGNALVCGGTSPDTGVYSEKRFLNRPTSFLHAEWPALEDESLSVA